MYERRLMEENIVWNENNSTVTDETIRIQNLNGLNHEELQTKYGILSGVSSIEWYPNGMIKECQVNERIQLKTSAGCLIPQYTNEGVRSKYIKSLGFYESGNIKKVALQEQTTVNTLAGKFVAELITFYDNGNVKRLFPLNGKITGYWTEDNEFELAVPINIKLPFGEYEKKLIGIHFYELGMYKSITLWPKELLKLQLSGKVYGVRFGISLYPSGNIKSLEPAYPIIVNTPIGGITAFDINATGINGDLNSLMFFEDGRVSSLMTSSDIIRITNKDKKEYVIKPGLKPSMISDNSMDIVPIYISFNDYNVTFTGEEIHTFDSRECEISITNNGFVPTEKCSSCASCNGCK